MKLPRALALTPRPAKARRAFALGVTAALALAGPALSPLAPGLAQTAAQPAAQQGQAVTLAAALQSAYAQGADLASANTTLAEARAALAALQSDPTALVTALTSARNAVALAEAQLAATRLTVLQSVLTEYTGLLETQENVKVLEAQVALDARNVEVARARQAAGSGTSLAVAQAENTLAASRQSLVDAGAQLPITSGRLSRLMGLGGVTNLLASQAPTYTARALDLVALEGAYGNRLASLVQARQNVEVGELNVRLADNDYTPAATLREARATLENARRSLDSTQRVSLTSLRDAYRAVQDAVQGVSVAAASRDNANRNLTQEGVRLQSGIISRVELQTAEVSALRARYAYQQAVDAYWRALAALSVAAGADATGLAGAS